MPFCAAPIEHYFNSWHQLSPAVMVAPNYARCDLSSPSRSALAARPPLSIEKEARQDVGGKPGGNVPQDHLSPGPLDVLAKDALCQLRRFEPSYGAQSFDTP
jgi:hypothetical protein